MNFCPNCGAKIPSPDDAFCFNCGYRMGGPQPQAAQETPEKEREQPATAMQPAGQGISAETMPTPAPMPIQEPAAQGPMGFDEPETQVLDIPVTPGGQRTEEEKKTAAQRIAQAINGDDFALAAEEKQPVQAVPAEGSVAGSLQGLESLMEEKNVSDEEADAFLASPQKENLFAASLEEETIAQKVEDPQLAGQGGFGELERLMETESGEEVGEDSLFFGQGQNRPVQNAGTPIQQEPFAGGQTREMDAQGTKQVNAELGQLESLIDQQEQQAAMQRREYDVPSQRETQPTQQKRAPEKAAPPRPIREAQPRREETPRQQAVQPAPKKEVTHYTQPQALFVQEEPVQPQTKARQAAPPSPPLPAQREQASLERKPQKSAGGTLVKVLLIAVLVVVAICATTLTMLYISNRPGKTIVEFVTAVQEKDIETLQATVSVSGQPSEDGWLALCAAFESDASVEQLKNELNQQVNGADTAGLYYQAVQMEAEPLFLFINRYHIRLMGVQILAPGAADGTQMRLSSTGYFGKTTEEGVVYSSVMPGLYNGALISPDDTGSTQAFTIEAFAYPGLNVIGESTNAQESYTVMVANCISDSGVLYVDGVQRPEMPVNGTVTLTSVPLGSTITISAEQNGQMVEASVVFDDPSVTQLTFGEYTVAGAASNESAIELSPTEIENTMSVFYASYLECINTQSMGPLTLSTAENEARLEKRVMSDANKANMFEYGSVDCDEESIVTKEVNGQQVIEFNMTFTYSYWPRDNSGEKKQDSNHQSVQLVYQDGQWLVNYMVFVDDDDFDAHRIAEFK